VGNPLKDTAGPALNPTIKVANLDSLIVSPVLVQYQGWSVGTVVVAVLLTADIVWAIGKSQQHMRIEGVQINLKKKGWSLCNHPFFFR